MVSTNSADIREVLWKPPTSEFGQISGIRRLTEHPEGFSKVPTSEFGHLSGIFKPSEHPISFTTGTSVTGTTLCIHSSHRFAELRGSTRSIPISMSSPLRSKKVLLLW